MRNIIVLVGKAATGKDEIETQLEKNFGVRRLVSHTSRPKRDGEVDGENYYFTTKQVIDKMIKEGHTIEHTSYKVDGETWSYALSKKELKKIPKGKYGVVTVNPHGVNQLINQKSIIDNLIIVYLKSSQIDRMERYFKREKNNTPLVVKRRWEQRLEQDLKDFEWFESKALKKINELKIPILTYHNLQRNTKELDKLGQDVFKYILAWNKKKD